MVRFFVTAGMFLSALLSVGTSPSYAQTAQAPGSLTVFYPIDSRNPRIANDAQRRYDAVLARIRRCRQNASCYMREMGIEAAKSREAYALAVPEIHPVIRNALHAICAAQNLDMILTIQCYRRGLDTLLDSLEAIQDFRRGSHGLTVRTAQDLYQQLVQGDDVFARILGPLCQVSTRGGMQNECFDANIQGLRRQLTRALNKTVDTWSALAPFSVIWKACQLDVGHARCQQGHVWENEILPNASQIAYSPSSPLPGYVTTAAPVPAPSSSQSGSSGSRGRVTTPAPSPAPRPTAPRGNGRRPQPVRTPTPTPTPAPGPGSGSEGNGNGGGGTGSEVGTPGSNGGSGGGNEGGTPSNGSSGGGSETSEGGAQEGSQEESSGRAPEDAGTPPQETAPPQEGSQNGAEGGQGSEGGEHGTVDGDPSMDSGSDFVELDPLPARNGGTAECSSDNIAAAMHALTGPSGFMDENHIRASAFLYICHIQTHYSNVPTMVFMANMMELIKRITEARNPSEAMSGPLPAWFSYVSANAPRLIANSRTPARRELGDLLTGVQAFERRVQDPAQLMSIVVQFSNRSRRSATIGQMVCPWVTAVGRQVSRLPPSDDAPEGVGPLDYFPTPIVTCP